MTLSKVNRVMWRLRKENPGKKKVTHKALRVAIMKECGIHPRTLWYTRRALKDLGYIKAGKKGYMELTDNDLTGDMF